MSTEFTLNGQTVAHQFFGGQATGRVVSMWHTESEWETLVATNSGQVESDATGRPQGTLAEWFARVTKDAEVVWPDVDTLRTELQDLRAQGMVTLAAEVEQRLARLARR